MTTPSDDQRRLAPRSDEGPSHPKFAAAMLMIGIVVALIIISIATLP